MNHKKILNSLSSRIHLIYTWTKVLNTPFWALYTLLPFIMGKDLKASAWQIACFVSLKPMVSLFSPYWSAQIRHRPDRLRSNIMWSGFWGHLPFLFVPFIENPWYFVFASAIYMFFHRGGNPAWMEMLKVHVNEEKRHSVFVYGSIVYHVGGALFAILVGGILDGYVDAWKWMFPVTALLSFCSIFFQWALPVQTGHYETDASAIPVMETLKKPWSDAWVLIKARPDFARFQIGFMLGGVGLMLWAPVLPSFFIDVLRLNYKELSFALTLCKSIGYGTTLPLWSRWMNRCDIFSFSGFVILIAAFFPLGLIAAQWHIFCLYIAYFLYGVMQAGNELSWNLSGPIFAKHEDSSIFSAINSVTVGLRGSVTPPLGSLLYACTNVSTVLLLGGGFCLIAAWELYRSSLKEKECQVV